MNPVIEAMQVLEKALQSVPGVQEIATDPQALTSFPTLVIGPPQIQREGQGSTPTGARFPVYAVIEAGDRTVERMCLLEADVAEAIEKRIPDAVVVDSGPFAFPQGQTDLPSYQLIVEVGLS